MSLLFNNLEVELTNIKLYYNPSTGSAAVTQTDRQKVRI
jgi:hypothetical protein